jgi:CIC family chloride channel protein
MEVRGESMGSQSVERGPSRRPVSWERVRRVAGWLQVSPAGLVASALAVGLVAGLGAVVFRYLILWFTILFTGHADYAAVGHAPHPALPWLGPWFVALVPIVGGLLYGPLTERFAREARGHGVPEVMLAVAAQRGRIRPRVAIVKSIASALCIGCGGSVGREGPIVQIGSAFGSAVGQALGVPDARLRLLVACGAAGGISATFNAPIAGVVFALELILRDFEAGSFGVVVLSSVAADVVGRAAFGSRPFLALPPFALGSPWELPLYAVLGLLAAFAGIAFIRVLYGLEDVLDRLWPWSESLRPMVGGVVLGLLLLALPQMYGVGYPVLERAIDGRFVAWMLVLLLAAKLFATSLTIAIGGSGGVFAPALFMGAMLGSAFGQLVNRLFPSIAPHPGAYGLVGMGAVFAAAARAPMTSAIIIFELTDEYRAILPLLFAIAVAVGVSSLFTRDTIYTLKLRRRGIDLARRRAASLMELIAVRDAMEPPPTPLRQHELLGVAIARFTSDGRETLPVVDADGHYRGVVTSRQVEQALRDDVLDATVGSMAQPSPPVAPGERLEWARESLVGRDRSEIPVTADGGGSVVGWLTHRDVLRAYHDRLERDLSRAERRTGVLAVGPPLAHLRGHRVVAIRLDRVPPAPRVGGLRLPGSALVLAVTRGAGSFEPDERTELRLGDVLTLLVHEGELPALSTALGAIGRWLDGPARAGGHDAGT